MQVGDMVVCVDATSRYGCFSVDGELSVGKVYRVSKLTPGASVYVINDRSREFGYYAERFAGIESDGFVKCVDASNSNLIQDCVYHVKSVTSGGALVLNDDCPYRRDRFVPAMAADYVHQCRREGGRKWSVEVRVDGNFVLSISSDDMCGASNVTDFREEILAAAENLISFIGKEGRELATDV